jgi:predicted  nucleic acid-binding Zn-ribbon protein
MATDIELMESLSEVDNQIDLLRKRIEGMERDLRNAKTDLGQLKTDKVNLTEELRIYKNTIYVYQVSERELEIAGFKERLPEVLKKMSGKNG